MLPNITSTRRSDHRFRSEHYRYNISSLIYLQRKIWRLLFLFLTFQNSVNRMRPQPHTATYKKNTVRQSQLRRELFMSVLSFSAKNVRIAAFTIEIPSIIFVTNHNGTPGTALLQIYSVFVQIDINSIQSFTILKFRCRLDAISINAEVIAH